jgi:SAM-dependent methyltransferase
MLGQLRAQRNFRPIEPYLIGNVLDIGAGSCMIADLISRQHDITCIDVIDSNKTKLPLKIYDGKKLPFKDKTFDTSILLYVLHHSEDPDRLFKEALRVTKKRIIIGEDVYTGKLSLFLLKLFDTGNLLSAKDMPMPFNFRKEEEWAGLFRKYGKLEVRKMQMILPRKQMMFILDVTRFDDRTI